MLVSDIHKHGSVIGIHMSTPSLASLPLPTPSHPSRLSHSLFVFKGCLLLGGEQPAPPVLCLLCFLDSVRFLDTLGTSRKTLLSHEGHGASAWGCWGYHHKVPLTGGLKTSAVDFLTILKKHSKQEEQDCQGAEEGCAWPGCLKQREIMSSGSQGEISGSSGTSQVPTEAVRWS